MGCRPEAPQTPGFLEFRLHRWTGLEGGETLLLRRIGSEWSAIVLGDGQRFSCMYQRPVKPKSDWDHVWTNLLKKGLLDIPEGQLGRLIVEDGDGFDGEVTHEGKVKRFEIPHPQSQNFPAAKQILEISDLLADEFESPVFRADYDRGQVGEYLIKNCSGVKREYAR